MMASAASSPAHLGSRTAAHRVVLYTDERDLHARLASLFAPAILAGDPVVLVTTPAHRLGIEAALSAQGADPGGLRAAGRYLEVDAAEALTELLVGEVVDPRRLRDLVSRTVAPWCLSGEHVHVYGSMVNLLWDRGLIAAALDLEAAWNEVVTSFGFELCCAYPDQAFAAGPGQAALTHVCDHHSEVIRQPARRPVEPVVGGAATAAPPEALHLLVDRDDAAGVELRLSADEEVVGLQRLLDALDGQVAVLDADGRVLAANRAWDQHPHPVDAVGVAGPPRPVGAPAVGQEIAVGIEAVACGVVPRFELDYLADHPTATTTPSQQRLTVTRCPGEGPTRLLLRCEDLAATPR